LPVFIHNIAAAVPRTAYRQSFLRDVMLRQFEGSRRTQNLVRRVYDASGIERRHSVVQDLDGAADSPLFFCPHRGTLTPTTGERNGIYVQASQRLAAETGRSLLAANDRVSASDISHVITISCTGFHAPDPGFKLVRSLGLKPSTNRYNIGFMGCFAAFQGLQLARAICLADPAAVVMVICVEICSIHLQLDETPDNIVSASVFADGAAGALVSARPPRGPSYRVDDFATAVAAKGEKDMAWTIGDHGFEMVLSRYVPAILETNLAEALQPLLPRIGNYGDVRHWAVHPGGRAILDKVERGLDLPPERFASSRHVLANYGNMSSATILFVLRHLLGEPPEAREEPVVAMAFGPGITIESSLLTKVTE
jgi:predicted naringenin-chalcone synthase